MSGTIRSLVRPITFLVAGAALASLFMGPVLGRGSTGTTPSVTTYTRSVSCVGLGFYPTSSNDGHGAQGTMRYRASSDGDGAFLCDPGLPNGAVVTKVQFTVKDIHSTHEITDCALVRSGLATTTATSYQLLAGPLGTSGTPGIKRLTDSSIAYATIDNAKYGYWLQCRIGGSDLGIGIYGANVTYRITAANG